VNKKEIIHNNIKECGYCPGVAIRGKGTEILSHPKCIVTGWGLDSDDEGNVAREKNLLRKAIEKHGIDNLFVKEVRIAGKSGSTSFNFEGNHLASLRKFPLYKMLKTDFKDIVYVSLYTIPVVKAYVKMRNFDSSLESQQDMIRGILWDAEQKSIIDEFMDSSYDEFENQMWFKCMGNREDTWEYDGDYTLYHGPSLCRSDDVVEQIEGRMETYNEAVIEDFWNFTMTDEDPFAYDDPNGLVSVYSRKGKDWYVTSGIDQEQIFLTYRNEDGEIVEDEEFWYFVEVASEELVNKVASTVEGMKFDLEIRSIINNELHYGNWSWEESYEYNDDIFNLNILKKEFGEDNLQEFGWEILDLIDWENKKKYSVMVTQAYEKFLLKNLDSKGKLFGKYNNLNKLRKIVEKEGKQLVYSKVGDFTDEKQWAIKYKDEEYHFYLSELYETKPRKFYENASANLTKRKVESLNYNNFMKKAAMVFVGFDDSVDSGNCKSGTQAFCNRFDIDLQKVGGVRGDALLEMDYSSFTRRAVIEAIQKRGKMKEEKPEKNEDYVILHTHESKPHPMALDSNYTYEVVSIYSDKEAAEEECRTNPNYKWAGNSTGSVSWTVVKRSEVPAEASWKV
jgi:hypothetical protein